MKQPSSFYYLFFYQQPYTKNFFILIQYLSLKVILKMQKELIFEGHSLVTVPIFDQDKLQSISKDSNMPKTSAQDSNRIMQEEIFYQKEDIHSQNSIELSIEKCFMSEHAAVLQWQLKKYLEQSQIYLHKNSKHFCGMSPEGLPNQNQETSCRTLLKLISQEKLKEFGSKLLFEMKSNDKLGELLNIVVRRCPQQMAIELIKISEQILEEYLKCVEDTVEILDLYFLMNLAFQKSKKIDNTQTSNVSSQVSSQKQYRIFMLKRQKFIEIYCVTAILVLAQFFQNPYFQKQMSEPHKRVLAQLQNDDEEIQMQEQIDFKPQKKRKQSKDTL